MKPPFQEEEGPTPAKLCALYDLGGGVCLADSFAIYSVVAFLPKWATIGVEPAVRAQLETAASLVETNLPILYKLRDSPILDLVSLPCPPPALSPTNGHKSPSDQLPWFLINAARYSTHCVLGCSDTLTSLLVVLQRPWCILELCCSDTSTVAALHEVARLAVQIDHPTYSPALRLLAHELSRRTDNGPEISEDCQFVGTSQKCTKAHGAFITYKELSGSCLRSHNSFWIGLISTCAVYFGLTFSDLTKMLGDSVCSSPSAGAGTPSVLPANCTTSLSHSTSLPPRSQASSFVSPCHPERLAPLRRHSIDVISPTENIRMTGMSFFYPHVERPSNSLHLRDLLSLYARILEVFRERLI